VSARVTRKKLARIARRLAATPPPVAARPREPYADVDAVIAEETSQDRVRDAEAWVRHPSRRTPVPRR
jgi:hypothetical protein